MYIGTYLMRAKNEELDGQTLKAYANYTYKFIQRAWNPYAAKEVAKFPLWYQTSCDDGSRSVITNYSKKLPSWRLPICFKLCMHETVLFTPNTSIKQVGINIWQSSGKNIAHGQPASLNKEF